MLRQRTLRAARRTRQTGKRFAGVNSGQITDLAGYAFRNPEKRFSAPSSGSQSSVSPACHSGSKKQDPAYSAGSMRNNAASSSSVTT